MPPLPLPPLTDPEVDLILRCSEGRRTLYVGGDQHPGGVGHASARHHLITNAGLHDRIQETRNGAIASYHAFITRADMVKAAAATLNGAAGIWAREQLFRRGAADAPRSARSHQGMRAIINYNGFVLDRVRYAGAGGIMPAYAFKMILDRVDERPSGLHIHTFHPILVTSPDSRVTIKQRDGKKFDEVIVESDGRIRQI
jgi:hypothetical protein